MAASATATLLMMMVMLGGAVVDRVEAYALCNMSEEGLDACKPSVTKDPPAPVDPSGPCCEALAGADLACLCSYRHSLILPSLGIDPELAMALPSKCNLTTPEGC
uniref:Bifunctional inhibitor/plant lipid transfer protein/seed storage helical domain-containing protein n=1 Tax=Kalanchoe fedtschenkoi TaxID=63787 RepID=A0A7N0V276_KALFE